MLLMKREAGRKTERQRERQRCEEERQRVILYILLELAGSNGRN
jgi:hypothetical protein